MKNKMKIFCIFLCYLIISFLVFAAYSNYKNNVILETSTNIAEPFFEVVTNNVNKIDFLNTDRFCYEFIIKNYNDKVTSEVAFDYNIKFNLSQNNAPILLELYRIDGDKKIKTELIDNKTSNTESFGVEKEERKYVVEIIYDKNSKNILEKNLSINLNVECLQKEVNI